MTGKIERLVNAPRPKIERAQVETSAKTAAVSRNAPAQNNAFTNEAPPQLGTTGTHLARSAQPDALWGGTDRRGNDPAELMKLTPAQQVAKLAELRAQRDELHAKILERVIALDKKWDSAPTATKADALKEYAQTSDQLDVGTRDELVQMIHQAEVAQHRIDRLRRNRDGLPPARLANPEMKAKRAALNAELRAARKEHKAAVTEATKVVDDKGLKVDRLAVTEQVIDPSAPKPESDKSLLGMVKSFFNISWVFSWLTQKGSASQAKKHEVELEQQIQLQLLQDHQKEQAAKREGIRELAIEAAARKR